MDDRATPRTCTVVLLTVIALSYAIAACTALGVYAVYLKLPSMRAALAALGGQP